MSDIPKDRWKLKAGDGAGYSIALPFDPTDYDGWKGQLRPGPIFDPDRVTGDVVDLRVDETAIGDDPPVIRFYLLGTDVEARMDGWGGDIQVTAPNGEPLTLIELDIRVSGEFTTP